MLYTSIHLEEDDFEFAIAHTSRKYGEEYYSFVNSQHTSQGGTHQQAFREAIVKTIRDFYKKDFDPNDIRNSIVAALSIKVKNPIFESQTKTSSDRNIWLPTDKPFVILSTMLWGACLTSIFISTAM
jgi:topoisomerase-4 subunit B